MRKKIFIFLLMGIFAVFFFMPKVAAIPDEREFNPKYDTIFEDFDRADITDTVSYTGDVDLGEKAYLSVTFDDTNSGNTEDAIFKQGQSGENGVGNIVLVMRAPNADVTLDELVLGTRYSDNHAVYDKSFSELCDSDLENLPELTTEWQKYIINFANSYEDNEVYLDKSGNPTTVKVNSGSILGLHIFAAAGGNGTLDIQTIYTNTDDSDVATTSRVIWNDFLGADTVDKTKSSSAWWAGSATGVIKKRMPKVSDGGIMNVVSSNSTGKYQYAVIEAEGDLENLLVATSADGETWSDYSAYSLAIAINNIKGLSFKYEGDSNVVLSRIFLTNFQEDAVANKYPYLDPLSTQRFDDFNIPQSEINDNYENMSTVPQMEPANLYYRLSYSNGQMLEVKDGALVINAESLDEGYINFKTETRTPAFGYTYIVFKMKAEGGANLNGFRFNTGSGDHIWGNGGLLSDVGLPIAGLDDDNPYQTADGWSYVVVNMAASGLVLPGTGVATLDIYYSGIGKLYIDEIFFANDLFDNKTAVKLNDEGSPLIKEYNPTAEGYEYLGYVYAPNHLNHRYLKLTYKGAEDADLSGLRLGFTSGGTFWFSENTEGTLKTINGTLIPAVLTEVQTVYIDLLASGVNLDFDGFHIHSAGAATGSFEIIDAELVSKYLAAFDLENALTLDDEGSPFIKTFNPTAEGYEYLGYAYAPNTDGHKYLLLTYKGEAGSDLSGLRLQFGEGYFWFSENDQGTLTTISGALIPAVKESEQTIIIDLEKSGVNSNFDGFHIHSSGVSTGSFEIVDAKLLSKLDKPIFDLENGVALDDEGSPFIKEYNPTSEGYEHLGYVYAPNIELHQFLLLTYKGEEGADLSGLRLEFVGGGTFWFSENAQGTLRTLTGALIPAITTTEQTAIIDLKASGVDLNFEGFHIHSNGSETGSFEILDARLVSDSGLYPEIIENLPVYETPDLVAPTIQITNSTTAKVGRIEITYTASDNVSSFANIRIEIEVKKGSETVAVTNGGFEAVEGTYTVTVRATDEAGNEAEDTIQITVEAEKEEVEEKPGCLSCKDATSPAGLSLLGLAGLGLFFIRRKRVS